MSIDSSILISATFGDTTKSYLDWDNRATTSETLNYYIYDATSSLNLPVSGTDYTLNTFSHSSEDKTYTRNIFETLDSIIDLDFNEVYSFDESDLDIYAVNSYSYWSGSVVGQVVEGSSEWNALWKDTNVGGSLTDYDKNTIVHEIGHALGLSHPGENPNDTNYNTVDDTVMSYRSKSGAWGTELTLGDKEALKTIWGVEDDHIDKKSPTISTENNISSKYRTLSISENSSNVFTFKADEKVKWSVRGGADMEEFTINENTGLLSFVDAPSFKKPSDTNKDNSYEILVYANDYSSQGGGNTAFQYVTINVEEASDDINLIHSIENSNSDFLVSTTTSKETKKANVENNISVTQSNKDSITHNQSNILLENQTIKNNPNDIQLNHTESVFNTLTDQIIGTSEEKNVICSCASCTIKSKQDLLNSKISSSLTIESNSEKVSSGIVSKNINVLDDGDNYLLGNLNSGEGTNNNLLLNFIASAENNSFTDMTIFG